MKYVNEAKVGDKVRVLKSAVQRRPGRRESFPLMTVTEVFERGGESWVRCETPRGTTQIWPMRMVVGADR